jgi:2-oxoglutarate dehydrogenase E1 component
MSNILENNSHFFSTNIIFINELFQKYIANPNEIDASWVKFFNENLDEVKSILADYNGPSWSKRNLKVVGSVDYDISNLSIKEAKKDTKTTSVVSNDINDLELKLSILINNYRKYGHLACDLDPLSLTNPEFPSALDPQHQKINSSDLDKEINYKKQKTKISQIIANLQYIYSNKIGIEFDFIRDENQKNFLIDEFENLPFIEISSVEKLNILQQIIQAERLEQFIHKRFPGAKRFSVEGGESSICAIEKIISSSAKSDVKKIIIGMAHRGRLNVLTNVLGKPYHRLFAEFQGTPSIPEANTKSGDVKYHMGFSSSKKFDDKIIDLSLAYNPSHLEAVNCVVTGKVRAIQDLLNDVSRTKALALLIHGDAAFAGQGSVAENLVMNGIPGYDTGGVIHIIVNNQIGFTANPTDSRSTKYASDLAKSIDAPIFHVNGDDVEAVVKIANLISKYRQKFKKDVVLDIICYRKYGHNEGDEPLYTQPIMYNKIKDHPSLEKIYAKKLLDEKIINTEEYSKKISDFEKLLNAEFDKASSFKALDPDWLQGEWKSIKDVDNSLPKTAISKKIIAEIANKITAIPDGFNVNPKILRQIEARKQIIENGVDIDWGTAEALAFASLIHEGHNVRITGQDAGRGTFSHRHSILHDALNAKKHNIFSNINPSKHYEVYDSVLSEYGVMGFEYGYSLGAPNDLVIWEAQFGDFANGAQIIFDQFVASAEVKWLRKSGLVMLLPHGFEGQGPEHSSARLERYLQACADNNLRVVNITNPANFFHVLRRQLKNNDRKPLIVMSPKSLLRHKSAVSNIEEFTNNNFQYIYQESEKLISNDKIKKVLLCSGKVYYDLLEARQASKINDIAIIRIEQLYPFPSIELSQELAKYKNAEIIWCQEEPKNMGAWHFVRDFIEEVLIEIKHKNPRAKYVGRVACASPATGYTSYHNREQKQFITEALS